jgi:hypothetical protein
MAFIKTTPLDKWCKACNKALVLRFFAATLLGILFAFLSMGIVGWLAILCGLTVSSGVFAFSMKTRHIFLCASFLTVGFLIYNFWDIMGGNPPVLAVTLAGMGLALLGALAGRRSMPLAGGIVGIVFLWGLGGWMSGANVAGRGLIGVYDPVDENRAVFLFTEPCFIVDDGGGGVSIVPGGKWGVYPEHPNPEHVGKRIGKSRIIGVLEKGGVMDIYTSENEPVAILDFSLVSPNPSERGAVAISNPF